MRREEVRNFKSESRQTAELFERVILTSRTKQHSGLTMNELVDALSNAIGGWPRDNWSVAIFAVRGHTERLEELQQSSTNPR